MSDITLSSNARIGMFWIVNWQKSIVDGYCSYCGQECPHENASICDDCLDYFVEHPEEW